MRYFFDDTEKVMPKYFIGGRDENGHLISENEI